MIVAPAIQKDGKTVPDKTHIAVVYAGTTIDWHKPIESFNDVSTDLSLFGNGETKNGEPAQPSVSHAGGSNLKKAANNQAKDADDLAQEALWMSGGKQVTFTGHFPGRRIGNL